MPLDTRLEARLPSIRSSGPIDATPATAIPGNGLMQADLAEMQPIRKR